ncbi:DUF222 domain-containing protein [Nocardioides humilatus]|uniref:DUF222 domain-containing protein n=1 Tax=Nocardioides humilatus TaxID=2607660 RepID=UPI00165F33DC|nr:DUF222 domain-containing protein [Nocardioides humilatus]
MVAASLSPSHPLVACAETICDLLDEVREVQPLYMSPDDQAAALLKLEEAKRRLNEAELRVMAAAGDLAARDGARDIAAWLAFRTQAESGPMRADQKLAVAVDGKWRKVAEGMVAGDVSVEQARVIVHGLEALPDRVGADIVASAEEMLVGFAKELTPHQLRRAALHILDHVAPEIAEAEAARRLEREEQQARIKTALRTKRLGDGMSRTTITHPDASQDRLLTYVESFASPRKDPDTLVGEEDRIPYPQRMGQAFDALLEHLDPSKLPEHGGDATTVLVTISLESLQAELGTGTLLDGHAGSGELSATAIRRMACTAKIIPVVLGGAGEILDVGRAKRLHSPAMRKAMRLRDRGCRAEGCTIPARWCEAHHDHPWGTGGSTNLDDGRLYCPWHHHLAHNPTYTAELLPNGDVRFTRRR